MPLFQENTWQKIETHGIVTVITVLVWLYAEAETVKAHQAINFDVQFQVPHTHFIRNPDPAQERVSARFRCTTGQLERVEERLTKREPIQIELTTNNDPAIRVIEVDLKQKLSSLRSIADLAVSVESVTPEKPSIEVEGFVIEQLPVDVDAGHVIIADAAVVPPAVEVKLPHSMSADLDVANMRLTAKLDGELLLEREPGKHRFTDVPLRLPLSLRDNKHISVNPPRVTVTCTIRKPTTELTWSVPIWAEGPPQDLADFSFHLTDPMVSIKLIGPRNTIDRIEKGELKEEIWAALRVPRSKLSEAATTGKPTDHPVTFHLPAGVRASPSQERVQFKVKRQPAVGAPRE